MSDLNSGIDLKCIVNREHLQSDSKALVYLAMDISPPEVSPNTPNDLQPVNLCIALDRSGSMKDENKIEQAKIATMQLIQELKPSDFVSLVTFSNREKVEVSSRSAADIYAFSNAINQINARGATDIYSALQAALNEVAQQRAVFPGQPVNRIILLTDGQPTSGKDKIEEFVTLCELIRKNDISVTTLGLGSDYNEQLLTTIASTTGGLWYHVTDPNNLPMLFNEELVEMKTVVMQKPELQIQPMSGAEIEDIHKVRPVLDLVQNPEIRQGKYILPLNDIVGGQPQNVVVKVMLPPRQDGKYRIAQATLTGGGKTITRDVVVTYTNDPSLYQKETDPYPRILLMTSDGTIMLRQGVASGDETVINQAQTILKKTMNDPNAVTVVRNNELTMDMVNRFNNSYEKTVIKKGNLSDEEKKKVISETTILKKKSN
ncbi:MAG: VWA domain-containing protein [Candidatus Bathyarchaeota archaeon]|nr:VWA domain-containing protein [Candidatus Bathyarchaeota archaeon]